MLNLDLTCFNNCNVKSIFGAFFVGNIDTHTAIINKERSKWCGLGMGVGWITVNDQEKLETRLELCCVLEMIWGQRGGGKRSNCRKKQSKTPSRIPNIYFPKRPSNPFMASSFDFLGASGSARCSDLRCLAFLRSSSDQTTMLASS